ncbi:MAG: HAMP domain-containing histidine kinase [Clostridia bacterium]|nr:HAMP domain-containing histidine kinase [Clostridia bacterium]
MKGSITKRLVMTYSAVLGVFLAVTVLLLNITARSSLEQTLFKNLDTESAIMEELYRERVSASLNTEDTSRNVREVKERIKAWFADIKKLSAIGFSSNFALVIRTDASRYGIFTPGESQNEINFKSVKPEELASRLKDKSFRFMITGGATPYFAVSRPLSDEESNGDVIKTWIIAYTPSHELARLVQNMNLQGAYAVLIALCISAVLSYFLSKTISKPIKLLKSHAERIASRNFKTRVSIRTGDEIETLGEAMNKIAGDLNDYDLAQKRFLQNVSHELKTPVMSIMGYAEGLKDHVIENQDKALGVIIDECQRLQRLISEVLFLSKLETVEEFYSFRCDKLNGVLEESVEKIESLAAGAGVHIKTDFERDCLIEMDRDKLIQAVLNLLSNSIRYAKAEVVLETSRVPQGVQIRVRDDGPGIAQEELPRVFERFYKGKKGNTGLGMTIKKAIVERHKGIIDVGNAPEGGAVFTIILPVCG